jgi:hypothetical protein
MNIRWGNHNFTAGLQTFDVIEQPTFNEFLQRSTQSVRVRMKGDLIVPNDTPEANQPAVLVQLEKDLRAALKLDGQDFRVVHPDGTEQMFLRSADYYGGLRVLDGPIFRGDVPGVLVRRRAFEFEIGAEQILSDDTLPGSGGNSTVTYSQYVSYEGTGGPRNIILETMTGPPIIQTVNLRTMCRCVQRGQRVQKSVTGAPAFADPPLYPAYERQDLRVITPGTPSSDTRSMEWAYVFESTTPF